MFFEVYLTQIISNVPLVNNKPTNVDLFIFRGNNENVFGIFFFV